LGLSLACLVGTSCNTTPTLPLPPPLATVGVPDEQGFALVEGEAEPAAYVSVLNEDGTDDERGVITQADPVGAYSVKVKAKSDDRLIIWQTVDGETSELRRLFVPRPRD
jgi:hypothetical protein